MNVLALAISPGELFMVAGATMLLVGLFALGLWLIHLALKSR